MEMVFKFREGSRLRGDPQVVGKALQELDARHGRIEAPLVVDAARSPRSPLHKYFEWDDEKAAGEYRLQQARVLIASVVTVQVDGDETRPVRSFVNVGSDGYRPVEVVMSDADMRERALLDVRSAIASLKAKLSAFEELEDVIAALDRVEKVVQRKTPVAGRGRKGASVRVPA